MKLHFLLLLFFCQFAIAQDPYQDANLTFGAYKAGFRSGIFYDESRPALNEQVLKKGRAVHISVWYPAQVPVNAKPMYFKAYVDDITRMINPASVSIATTRDAIQQIKILTAQLHGDSVIIGQHISKLLASETKAFSDVVPVEGSFPVVFYPENSWLNNVMCEFLASHGYIVVSTSRHGSTSADFEWQTVNGIETLVKDSQYALSILINQFKLKDPPIAVMGVGMNASAGLAWMMRDTKVKALVSLEGGILTRYEYGLIQKSPHFSKEHVKNPMLIIHSPHESVNPDLIDNYAHADRHMVHLPRMSEFYYLNFGVWENTMTGILGPAPGDTRTGFKWEALYTLNFLDWHLKQKESGRLFFAKTPEQLGAPKGIVEYRLKPAQK
jgi:hypothetical protein